MDLRGSHTTALHRLQETQQGREPAASLCGK